MDATNRAILAAIEGEVLSPAVVQATFRKVVDEQTSREDTVVPRRTALQAELTVLDQELTRLSAAVAQGGDLPALMEGCEPESAAARPSGRSWLDSKGYGTSRPSTSSELSGSFQSA